MQALAHFENKQESCVFANNSNRFAKPVQLTHPYFKGFSAFEVNLSPMAPGGGMPTYSIPDRSLVSYYCKPHYYGTSILSTTTCR
jgi:hypothetical protein